MPSGSVQPAAGPDRRPSPGGDRPLLVVSGLGFTVGGETILAGIDFSVDAGEFVCVLGPSGCGKTTLLRLIGGLLRPSRGEVRIAGADPARQWRQVAYVFQSARLCGWRTAAQNVALGLELRDPSVPRAERLRRAEEYLRLVQLEDRRDRYPATLSGGEAQRVALARALAVESPILLMDEPFANLDVRTRRHLRRALLDVWKITGRTILFVTHDLDEALILADRIIVLSDRPTRVRRVVTVDVPRPRDPADPALEPIRSLLLADLTGGRRAAGDEDGAAGEPGLTGAAPGLPATPAGRGDGERDGQP